MALTFGEQKGSAQKGKMDALAFKDGMNQFRIVGDILPRYVYWVKGENNKNIPMECLAFNRDTERFDNAEKDWVQEYYPDLKCGWAYVTQCLVNGELKLCNLKKKMWEQINTAAEDLGDPTNQETGWDIMVKRAKTGPMAYNVEYTLAVLKCKPRALTAEELEAIAEIKSMDEVMVRPTPEDQKKFLDRIREGVSEEQETDEDIEKEFDVT